jgi:hypothetical protein
VTEILLAALRIADVAANTVFLQLFVGSIHVALVVFNSLEGLKGWLRLY